MGTRCWRSIGFTIEEGSVTGLLGPSGCGKSTLMRSLVGIQRLTSGSVKAFGEEAGGKALRNRIGYVTQAASVYDDLTVAENLRFFAQVLGVDKAEVNEAIDAVDLRSHADQVVGQLSGGQRSRTSLAVALLGNPDLLVLDEPTVGLDPVLRRDLWKLFHEIAERGAAVFVSSHVMDEADRCDRLLLMRDGRIIADDTPDRIREKTRTRDIESAFLALVEGHRRPGRRTSMNPRITLAVATRVLAQIRRDHRTAALLLVVPCLLMTLLWWMFKDIGNGAVFDRLGPGLLALFPFIIMFLVTSVTTLRERKLGHARTPAGHADGQARLPCWLRHRLRRGGRDPVGARRRPVGRSARPRRTGSDLAAYGRRHRGCGAWLGARPVRQRLRDHRVPGGAVHAGVRGPADPAVRTVRGARPAAHGPRRSATCCRSPTRPTPCRHWSARVPPATSGRTSAS